VFVWTSPEKRARVLVDRHTKEEIHSLSPMREGERVAWGDLHGRGDEQVLVWGGAVEGDVMHTIADVYKEVERGVKKGRTVKSCCRSIALKWEMDVGVLVVAAAGIKNEWYKKLGFDKVAR